MNLSAHIQRAYKVIVEIPFSGVDSVEFAELNAHKVDEVKYFIFGDKANHFSLVTEKSDNALKCPFSSSFGIVSEIRQNLGIKSKFKSRFLYKLC
ncbi:hypothetical protein [Helicobacter sp. T3_23-1059]